MAMEHVYINKKGKNKEFICPTCGNPVPGVRHNFVCPFCRQYLFAVYKKREDGKFVLNYPETEKENEEVFV